LENIPHIESNRLNICGVTPFRPKGIGIASEKCAPHYQKPLAISSSKREKVIAFKRLIY
jgi:hypothetical protein